MMEKEDLEIRCPTCKDKEYRGRCHECGFDRYVPTELGEAVLNLVERHFARILKQSVGN